MARLARRRLHRVLTRSVAAGVLATMGIGLTPGAAAASDSPDSTTATRSDAGHTALLTAVGYARQARIGIGDDHRWTADELGDVSSATDAVAAFLTSGATPSAVGPGPLGDVTRRVDQVRAALDSFVPDEADGLYEAALADAEELRAVADGVVADLSGWAYDLVSGVAGEPPSAGEVVALARSIEAQVRGERDGDAEWLLGELARIASSIVGEHPDQTVKVALTTLLLTLADAVNPLADGLAPTTQEAFDAAGELARWADEQVQSGSDVSLPDDGSDDDGEEPAPSPTDDLPLDEGGLYVGDEPVIVTGPAYVGGDVPADDEVNPLGGIVPDTTGGGCGMYPDEICAPPMKSDGGRVIHRPTVRVVLVGSWWKSQPALTSALDNVFGSMGGSDYQDVLRQYYDTQGYISATVVHQGAHLLDIPSPQGLISDAQVAGYAVRAAGEHEHWATHGSVVWVVALPPGAIADVAEKGKSPYRKCGYQNFATRGDKKYVYAVAEYPRAVHPDGSRPGCQYLKGNVRASLTTIAVHEYVGAVTNPEVTGWYDGIGQHLPDLCRALLTVGPGGETVSKLWSNGDDRCVSSFTPRMSYEVVTASNPVSDPGGAYTKGHRYPGAEIRVKNTGNIAWMSAPRAIYLVTTDGACSPFADEAKGGGWASCDRVAFPVRSDTLLSIAPGGTIGVTFTLKPDGTHDEGRIYDQAFTLRIPKSPWSVSNSGSRPLRLSDIRIANFAGEAVGATPLGYVAVGQHGTTIRASVILRNVGDAVWYANEVMYLGTPRGTVSKYAARDWPTGPGGCRDCRAHRFMRTVLPGDTYQFTFALRLPDREKDLLDVASFVPYADVAQVTGGLITSTELVKARFDVRLVMLPKPVTVRDIAGYGFAGDDDTSTAVDESGFTCAAASGADATATRITSCTAQVTSGTTGTTTTFSASAASASGSLAGTSALATGYDPADGDTITVCWAVEATFLDGTVGTHSGCTT